MIKKVVIGRFQVPQLTQGHKDFLNKINPDILLLGVSPLDTRDAQCPYSWSQRVYMLKNHYPALENHIFPIFDQPNDAMWSKRVDRFLADLFPDDEFVLYGGRDSFLPHYTGQFRTQAIEPTKHPSGTEVREAITRSHTLEFKNGQAYTLCHQWPHVYPTVDIAVFCPSRLKFLIIQRADTGEWGLPGGFVDPMDVNLEAAANRELREEVGINLETDQPDYWFSSKVPDWRYRKSKDGIMTSVFGVKRLWGDPSLSAEVTAYEWASLNDMLFQVCEAHKHLVIKIKERVEKL